MESIDFQKLRQIAKDKQAKIDSAKDSKDIVEAYKKLEINLVDNFQNSIQDEAINYIMSTQNWLLKKENTKWKGELNKEKISIGDIFIADLGTKYKPEIAYTHPVLVLEIVKNYVLIIPTTTNEDTYNAAYHPIDNPKGKKQYRRVKPEDGFSKECSLILTNIQTISKGRLLDKKGSIFNIELFNEIKMQTFYFTFPRQYKKFIDNTDEISCLKQSVMDINKQLQKANEVNEELERELQRLRKVEALSKQHEIEE